MRDFFTSNNSAGAGHTSHMNITTRRNFPVRPVRSSYERLFTRRLGIETLEDRRMLAGVVVGNFLDVVNGNTTTIANLIADPGADGISLREAILAANATAGADVVSFADALSGQKISLGGTELMVTEALTIDARSLAAQLTIDGGGLSRVFNITAAAGNFMLGGLVITGGRTTGSNASIFDSTFSGGAVRSRSADALTMAECVLTGNATLGALAVGGGVFASGSLSITDGRVNENYTVGDNAWGGGITAAGSVIIVRSTVNDNRTAGLNADGGGIFAGSLSLSQSTVSGNSTTGVNVRGSGIASIGDVTLTQSTVSANRAEGFQNRGAGIWTAGGVTITQSTVTENRAVHITASAGGVFQTAPVRPNLNLIDGSIVAGNVAPGDPGDFVKTAGAPLTVFYSVIGTSVAPTAGAGIATTNAPQLGPLAENGGPTRTHALLAGSPAIDAGDPSVVFNPAQFDQRGAPYVRVSGGRIDIGAVESQPAPASADFNASGRIDGFDFLIWQRGFGASGAAATPANGNADGDSDVDAADLDVWRSQFGNPAVVSTAESAVAAAMVIDDPTPTLAPQNVDAALAHLLWHDAQASRPPFRPRVFRAR